MKNIYQKYKMMYDEAHEDLVIAINQFNNIDPNDIFAVDAAIFKIAAAEKLVESIYARLKKYNHREEQQLCLA